MMIDVLHPFTCRWRKAYLRVGKDGRKRVDLYNSKSDRSTMSYARYLLSNFLGRELTKDEEADHIDGDKTNDSIRNLQVLDKESHSVKTTKEDRSQDYVLFTCPVCFDCFVRRAGRISMTTRYCSRTCNGKSNGFIKGKTKNLLKGKCKEVEELFKAGNTCYFIAKALSLPKSSVEYYVRTRLK